MSNETLRTSADYNTNNEAVLFRFAEIWFQISCFLIASAKVQYLKIEMTFLIFNLIGERDNAAMVFCNC